MNTDQIASEAARDWLLRLRQWQGFDLTEYQQASLIESFQSAIEKALAPLILEVDQAIDAREKLREELGAAYASERPTPDTEGCTCGYERLTTCKVHPTATASENTDEAYNELARSTPREARSPFIPRKPDSASSGGGEWKVERVKENVSNPMARIMRGDKVIIGWTMRPFSESFDKIADAHNQSLQPRDNERIAFERLSKALTGGNASTWEQIFHAAESQPRDCGEDTKRLDWLMSNGYVSFFVADTDDLNKARKAIDDAMKSQT